MLAEILETIVTTVKQLLSGLGEGLVDFFQDIFTVSTTVGSGEQAVTTTGLSTLGIFIICLLGISIALAAVRWVTSLVRPNGR
jgi:uncharacterized membrane protein YidH (DUF202 family)